MRIEFRALPAGPTVVDMVANGAFLLGLTLGLAERVDALLPALPFGRRGATSSRPRSAGLDAVLLWPSEAPRRARGRRPTSWPACCRWLASAWWAAAPTATRPTTCWA